MKIIRVIAKKDGFRRAGRSWSGTTEIPASELSQGQIEALKAEPNLVIDEIDVDEAGEDKPAKPAKTPPK